MTTLQPGRETDAAVARVLGCKPVLRKGDWRCECDDGAHITKHVDDEQGDWQELASYSTKDADMLAGVDVGLAKRSLNRDGYRRFVQMTLCGDGRWCFQIEDTWCYGATRAEAGCRAILALAEAVQQ